MPKKRRLGGKKLLRNKKLSTRTITYFIFYKKKSIHKTSLLLVEATSSNASIELILLQLIAELYRYRDMEKEWYH